MWVVCKIVSVIAKGDCHLCEYMTSASTERLERSKTHHTPAATATVVNDEDKQNAECAVAQVQDIGAGQPAVPVLTAPNSAMNSPPSSRLPSKAGRKPSFTPDDVLIRELSAAKAHVAEYGKVRERFQCAADTANMSPCLSVKVNAKSIQDRYKKLQDAFDRGDSKNRNLSGVGGEMGEAEELLSHMKEVKDDARGQQDA